MEMAEEPDRLSQLPDVLLQHILHLAPSWEAESTAVLSRRWRGLWPPATVTIKIDVPCPYKHNIGRLHDDCLRGAEEALAAARGPADRLAIDIGPYYRLPLHDIVGNALAHPASRSVKDVRVGADTSGDPQSDDGSFSWIADRGVGVFEFSFGVVVPTSAALRVLHVTNCCELTPPPPASTWPCLEVLRLRRCIVSMKTLQDMVVASPKLAVLQLEYVFLTKDLEVSNQRLYCPGVTTLVLVNCCCENEEVVGLSLPRVQHFKYRGKISQFKLRSPMPDLRRAYVHILASNSTRNVETCKRFWSLLKNFSDTNVLKLKLDSAIDYVDPLIVENQSAQSIRFSIQQIDATYNTESKDIGVAIGNLLQCFPGLRDLRLKLESAKQPFNETRVNGPNETKKKSAKQHKRKRNLSTSLQSKAQLDFHKSIDYFRRRRDHPVVPFCRDDAKLEVSDIPGLSDRWSHFSCLQFHLKRLSLQFHMDKDNSKSMAIRLLKFFIERGMALEEVYIGDGIMRLWEHMICKISGHPANHQPFSESHVSAIMSQALSKNQFSSSKIRGRFHPYKLEEVRRTNLSSASRSFKILPLADA